MGPLPEGKRYRCRGCGNKTRFTRVRALRVEEFWHQTLAGEGVVEKSETLSEEVETVTCHGCGRGDAVEVIDQIK